MVEEIDFQGISEYILSELLLDVKVCLFGKKSDREVMRETIYSKAISYSKAGSKRQEDKVKKLIDDSLDILCNFYRMQIDDTDLFMSAETIDAIVKELKKELDKKEESISAEIESESQRVIDEIKKQNKSGGSKVAENILLRELHEFIMKNYIKERYRNEELSEQDIETYSDLFKLCIDIYNDNGRVEVGRNIFDFVRDVILNQKKGNLIKIVGPDGTGKNTFLSILYIYLYNTAWTMDFPFVHFILIYIFMIQ